MTTKLRKALNREASRSTGSGAKQTLTRSNRLQIIKKITYFCLAPFVLLNNQEPAHAIFNCFKPMNRVPGPWGHQYHSGERGNWYTPQVMGYPTQYTTTGQYAMNPMKMLFQPKFKSNSWFGSKGGWNGWRMGSPFGLNRHQLNYGGYAPVPYSVHGTGYQFSSPMQVAPFSLPSPINPYSSVIQSAAADAGWSIPVNQSPSLSSLQQYSTNGYDSTTTAGYGTQPPVLKQPMIDPYGGTKGGNSSPRVSSTSTTRNSLLVGTGAYGALDSYLQNLNAGHHLRNQSFGYAYPPNWFSEQLLARQQYVDSPAKIAQQLFKYNLKRQRLIQDQNHSLSAALIANPTDLTDEIKGTQFTILDEPRFVGFGTVDELSNSEARLSCSFNEAIDEKNRPVWIKFVGTYNSSEVVNGKNLPPFNCASQFCRTQEVESTKDYRYKFDNGPATSMLIIKEPRLSDYGIYRCSALTKTINNNPLETIYQIVRFGLT